MKKIEKLYKAFADKTRLAMLALILSEGELCVSDFVQVLELTQSKASRHLRYMENSGLLESHQLGLWVFYSMSSELNNDAKILIRSFRKIMGNGIFDDWVKKLQALKSQKKFITRHEKS